MLRLPKLSTAVAPHRLLDSIALSTPDTITNPITSVGAGFEPAPAELDGRHIRTGCEPAPTSSTARILVAANRRVGCRKSCGNSRRFRHGESIAFGAVRTNPSGNRTTTNTSSATTHPWIGFVGIPSRTRCDGNWTAKPADNAAKERYNADVTESVVEQATLDWLAELGWHITQAPEVVDTKRIARRTA